MVSVSFSLFFIFLQSSRSEWVQRFRLPTTTTATATAMATTTATTATTTATTATTAATTLATTTNPGKSRKTGNEPVDLGITQFR